MLRFINRVIPGSLIISLATCEAAHSREVARTIKVNNLNDKADNSPEHIQNKHRAMIIEQAYRDLGFNGPVFVEFNHFYQDSFLRASNIPFYSRKGRGALVQFPASCEKMDDAEVYAIAGHEAVHQVHWHKEVFFLSIPLLMTMIRGPKSLSLFLAFLTFVPRQQIEEVDADITSAKKLNTAKDLADNFKKLLPVSKKPSVFTSWKSTHPPTKCRIAYLSKFASASSPLLFKSETYNKILQERKNPSKKEMFWQEHPFSARRNQHDYDYNACGCPIPSRRI